MSEPVEYSPTTKENDKKGSRCVPLDLIPVLPREVHFDWGAKTYKYYHLFNPNINKDCYSNNEEIIDWTRYANKLQKELKETGLVKANEEVLRLCKKEFNMLRTDGQIPVSITDVVSILRQTTWYNQDKHRSRHIVYMMSHGIVRSGYNKWVYQAVYEWMKAHKIAYDRPEITNSVFNTNMIPQSIDSDIFQNKGSRPGKVFLQTSGF